MKQGDNIWPVLQRTPKHPRFLNTKLFRSSEKGQNCWGWHLNCTGNDELDVHIPIILLCAHKSFMYNSRWAFLLFVCLYLVLITKSVSLCLMLLKLKSWELYQAFRFTVTEKWVSCFWLSVQHTEEAHLPSCYSWRNPWITQFLSNFSKSSRISLKI